MNLTNVDLNLLAVFEAILEERSVSAAARRLGRGQPATSEGLGRLRSVFQDPLFVRTPGRGMVPTAKALRLAEPIGEALRQARTALTLGQPFAAAQAQFAIRVASAPDYFEFVILPRLLAKLATEAPGVDLRMLAASAADCTTLLDRGQADVGIEIFGANLRKRFTSVPLIRERSVCLVSTDQPAWRKRGLADFAAQPHVARSLHGELGRTGLDRALAKSGHTRRVVVTVSSFLALPGLLAANSQLVATIPERIARGLTQQHSGLTIREPPLPLPSWTIELAWSKALEQDEPHKWTRQTIQRVCAQL